MELDTSFVGMTKQVIPEQKTPNWKLETGNSYFPDTTITISPLIVFSVK